MNSSRFFIHNRLFRPEDYPPTDRALSDFLVFSLLTQYLFSPERFCLTLSKNKEQVLFIDIAQKVANHFSRALSLPHSSDSSTYLLSWFFETLKFSQNIQDSFRYLPA